MTTGIVKDRSPIFSTAPSAQPTGCKSCFENSKGVASSCGPEFLLHRASSKNRHVMFFFFLVRPYTVVYILATRIPSPDYIVRKPKVSNIFTRSWWFALAVSISYGRQSHDDCKPLMTNLRRVWINLSKARSPRDSQINARKLPEKNVSKYFIPDNPFVNHMTLYSYAQKTDSWLSIHLRTLAVLFWIRNQFFLVRSQSRFSFRSGSWVCCSKLVVENILPRSNHLSENWASTRSSEERSGRKL